MITQEYLLSYFTKGRMKVIKDIFISYKNDGEGNNFAARLKQDLENEGYDVYFNSHEQTAGMFPKRLEGAVRNCKDFLLVLSSGCLEQLISNNSVDWVREELLCAKKYDKNIISILIGNVKMPISKMDFPTEIQFLVDLEAVVLPEQYLASPFYKLTSMFKASPFKNEYQYIGNSNAVYNVQQDFHDTLEKAKNDDDYAIFEIACMYFYGFTSECGEYGESNYVEASKWLKVLLRKYKGQNNPPEFVVCAHIMLANMYYTINEQIMKFAQN